MLKWQNFTFQPFHARFRQLNHRCIFEIFRLSPRILQKEFFSVLSKRTPCYTRCTHNFHVNMTAKVGKKCKHVSIMQLILLSLGRDACSSSPGITPMLKTNMCDLFLFPFFTFFTHTHTHTLARTHTCKLEGNFKQFNIELHSFVGYLRFVHIILIKIPQRKNRKENINLSGGGGNDTHLHLFEANS